MANFDPFPSFPDDARVWVYASAAPLDEQDARSLRADVEEFLARWTSHGQAVTAAVELIDRRFLLVAGFVSGSTVSGCGIDASVRALDETAARRGIEWASPLDIFIRDDTLNVQCVSRGEFRRMAQKGLAGADTIVIDPSVTSVGDLRTGRFEGPAHANWHRQLLGAPGALVP